MQRTVRNHNQGGDSEIDALERGCGGVLIGSVVLEGTWVTPVKTKAVHTFDPEFPLLEIILKATVNHRGCWKRMFVSAMFVRVKNGNNPFCISKAMIMYMMV